MKFGDALLLFGMFIWLCVAVGPWWVGAALFVVASVVNYAQARR
jgi:hypothetical protein